METRNSVFIATSIDGYIADKNGEIDWLHSIPNPEGLDLGYGDFMAKIDALVMGRNTFETVCSFDMDWPYQKPVFVLSNSLSSIPEGYEDKAFLLNGPLYQVLESINDRGYHRLYIDGGQTIQNFLREDLIDSMTITTIPYLLGEGIPLFGELSERLKYKCVDSKLFLDSVVQNHFVRIR